PSVPDGRLTVPVVVTAGDALYVAAVTASPVAPPFTDADVVTVRDPIVPPVPVAVTVPAAVVTTSVPPTYDAKLSVFAPPTTVPFVFVSAPLAVMFPFNVKVPLFVSVEIPVPRSVTSPVVVIAFDTALVTVSPVAPPLIVADPVTVSVAIV